MPASSLVRYRVAMPEPTSHEFAVTMDIPALPKASVDLVFPAWAPGSYMVRDFSRHVYDLRITDRRGRALAATRVDKQRWRVSTKGEAVRVCYQVFAFETSVRTSFLDDSHAFWNGTSLFFFVEGEIDRPCQVEVEAPRGWRVSTALPGGRSRFRAANFDELADSPFEVGTHEVHAFYVRGVRFEVALYGRTNADVPRLLTDLQKIVAATGRLFGGFPFGRYLFIVHALPARGGGLEHACSATLDIAGLSFEDEKGYQAFNELAAHEFFHAWNVKRIRDRVLGRFDYTRENYTRLLWFHEGFTEYMESIILLRAGLISPSQYLQDLQDAWRAYLSRPGRNVTPLSELSFEAWIKQYKPADNHINRMVSYYDKGRWAALVLELMLRQATHGRRGIPDLFRALWRRFGVTGVDLDAREVCRAAESVAGRSFADYFARYIDGTDELPVPLLLRRAGVRVRARAPWEDEGDRTKRRRSRAWAGLSFVGALGGAAAGDRAVIRNVIPGSPAWRAGLTYGDEIVAVADHRVTASSVDKRFADVTPGERVSVTFFRRDGLKTVRVQLAQNPARLWAFSFNDKPSRAARAVRRAWLGV